MTTLTPTALRENLYKVLDKVANTGVPQEVVRKGKKLKIVLAEGKTDIFKNLKPHPGAINGDPEDLVNIKLYTWKPPKNL